MIKLTALFDILGNDFTSKQLFEYYMSLPVYAKKRIHDNRGAKRKERT